MLSDAFVPMLTYPEQATPESLPLVTQLLENFATHVTYCGVEISVPDFADRWGASLVSLPQMAAELESRSRQCAIDLLNRASSLESRLQSERLTIRAAFSDPGPAAARQARHHDLSAFVMRERSADHQGFVESLLFGSGRPVILIPEGGKYSAALDTVAIAWDGSPTAYRAVFDAMPIITRATNALVLTASAEKQVDKDLTSKMLAYLARHGVLAHVRAVVSSKAGIGSDLQDSARSAEAGMLIMGAYGHSRLREFVLGGATADALSAPVLPLFMSR